MALATSAAALAPAHAGAVPALAAPASDFTLKSATGENLRLSEYRGDVVVIVFWATWCTACRQQLAEFDRIYREYRAAGLTVLAIALDEDRTKAQASARDLGLTYPILFDANKKVSEQYAIDTLPTAFFVDRDGVLRHIIPGYRPGEEAGYVTHIRRLLAE